MFVEADSVREKIPTLCPYPSCNNGRVYITPHAIVNHAQKMHAEEPPLCIITPYHPLWTHSHPDKAKSALGKTVTTTIPSMRIIAASQDTTVQGPAVEEEKEDGLSMEVDGSEQRRQGLEKDDGCTLIVQQPLTSPLDGEEEHEVEPIQQLVGQHIRELEEHSLSSESKQRVTTAELFGMQSLADFKEMLRTVRVTPDDRPDIIDTICAINGGTRKAASKILERIQAEVNVVRDDDIQYFKFPGPGKAARVAKNWSVLSIIASHIPGEEGDYIRSQNAKLSARVAAGEFIHRDNVDALVTSAVAKQESSSTKELVEQRIRELEEHSLSSESKQRVTTAELFGMQSLADFKEMLRTVRVTPDDRPDIIDTICAINGGTRKAASKILERIQAEVNVVRDDDIQYFKFPGPGKAARVAKNWSVLSIIASHIPGEEGDYIRSQNAKLSARANAGDSDLRDAIEQRRKELPAQVQEMLLKDQPSTKKALNEREAKKLDEAQAQQKQLTFDINLLRGINSTRARSVPMSDIELTAEWQVSGENVGAFVQSMMQLQTTWLSFRKAEIELQDELDSSARKKKAQEEEAERQKKAADEEAARTQKAADEEAARKKKLSDYVLALECVKKRRIAGIELDNLSKKNKNEQPAATNPKTSGFCCGIKPTISEAIKSLK